MHDDRNVQKGGGDMAEKLMSASEKSPILQEIKNVLDAARGNVARQVNSELLNAYWHIARQCLAFFIGKVKLPHCCLHDLFVSVPACSCSACSYRWNYKQKISSLTIQTKEIKIYRTADKTPAVRYFYVFGIMPSRRLRLRMPYGGASAPSWPLWRSCRGRELHMPAR